MSGTAVTERLGKDSDSAPSLVREEDRDALKQR
jgi:hypothetical protein